MSQQQAPMSDGLNRATAAALRLLDALLLRNPERTAIGVALGLGIAGIFDVFQPLAAAKGIIIGRLDWWAAVSLGLLLVHAPFVFWSVRHKPVMTDELDSLIRLIECTNIGELEKRAAYRRIVNKCIDEFALTAPAGTVAATLSKEAENIRHREVQIPE